ncbi:MAG: XdhC family protein [Pyrinomonadaceae bacterium]|nr:XdhC family protein [Pyrinomonadaceae bacterium]
MKEFQEIIEKISKFQKGEKAVLATVVDVVGSGYRRPGARMLIDENGFGIGTVSGGCLEADVLERAKKVLDSGEATVITYDTTKDENSVFGLSMGCRGIVRILLEEIDSDNIFFNFLGDSFEARKPFTMATVVTANDDSVNVGAKYFLQDPLITLKALKPQIPGALRERLNSFSAEKGSKLETFDFGEVFFENIEPPLNLLLFGAGYDALPLVKFAKELGWRVTAIDHRAAFANAERLPQADEIIVSASEDLKDELFADGNSVAVLMTHNYERDRNILRLLLNSNCRYVGALGPKHRAEKLLNEINEPFTESQLAKLHAPVGLDIGADSPEAIALAIVAEIQAVLSGREGGFLRKRQGSIYGRG